jgi:hypothetical protein
VVWPSDTDHDYTIDVVWPSDCCLTPSEPFFSYILARIS